MYAYTPTHTLYAIYTHNICVYIYIIYIDMQIIKTQKYHSNYLGIKSR